jgi:hypothetical protein
LKSTITNPLTLSKNKKILLACDVKVKQVVIPSSVTTIAEGAFAFCADLKSLTLPNHVTTIHAGAFMHTGFTTLYLSKFIKVIKEYAFCAMPSLKRIIVDPNNPYFTSKAGVLYSKDMKKLIAYPSANPRTIFTLPREVQHIWDGALTNNHSLTQININENLHTIGNHNIGSCNVLEKIQVHPNNRFFTSIDQVLFNKQVTTLISAAPSGMKKNYVVPESVENIAPFAFHHCHYLKSITFPRLALGLNECTFKDINELRIEMASSVIKDLPACPYVIKSETLIHTHFSKALGFVIQPIYVSYFTEKKTYTSKDKAFRMFLHDMDRLSTMINRRPSFSDILKPLFAPLPESLSLHQKYEHILTHSEKHQLTLLQLFSLLWYASCRNALLYQERIYQLMAEKGMIGRLLFKINQILVTSI